MQVVSVSAPSSRTHARAAPGQLLSIVIPCYDEEEVIQETISRLGSVCTTLDELSVELIFVDDGSRDGTRALLKEHASRDSRIKIIGLARNFGHQVAVTAGMDAANGDAVIIIDADLQDPPELIQQMVNKWRAGYDVVYGARAERAGESLFKKTTAKLFYRILNRISEVPIPLDTGDFRLMTKHVVDTLRAMPEHDRFVRGLVSWVGLKQIALPYHRAKRLAGKSHYPLMKMVRFATDGIFSFSRSPLQLSVALGVFCALLSVLGIFYALILRLFTRYWVAGWTAIMIALLFLGGVQLLTIGILGEYIGRIYNEIKRRPLYIVEEYCGYEESAPAMSRSPINGIQNASVRG